MIKFNDDNKEDFLTSPYTSLLLTAITDSILKNYLCKIYLGEIKCTAFRVKKILTVHSSEKPIPKLPTINFDENKQCHLFTDKIIFFSVEFKEEEYEVSFLIEQQYYEEVQILFNMSVTGISKGSNK
jgi:hypothetical protein